MSRVCSFHARLDLYNAADNGTDVETWISCAPSLAKFVTVE